MRRLSLRSLGRPAPRSTYTEARTRARFADRLSGDELERLNKLLPWRCFTVDSHGRPLGGVASPTKRSTPQLIPDPRIEQFHGRFDLSDKHVLEVGCFEGVHTIALCGLAERVTAIDGRVENVAKTVVRCAMFDQRPRVFTCDIEEQDDEDLLRADLCHHVGVLYHLSDPVTHLRRLGGFIARGLMLDTHYASAKGATEEYTVDGERFRFRRYEELGREDVFSGLRRQSKWLQLDDISAVLRGVGFDRVEIVETRVERNGPRVLLFAERSAA
jgi:2-polyprenyl-3-methyl-5-hydroxy-6-metoxy-1,4-benzoquinol methylase